MAAKPKIDDQFWFDFSSDVVTQGTAKRAEAAGKLSTLLVWLWGIYTAAAALGVSLAKIDYPIWVLLLIVGPVPVLVLAYWSAVWAQMPLLMRFDPRSPDEIREAYAINVERKTGRLITSLILSFVASVLVAVAIVASSVAKQEKPPAVKAVWRSINAQTVVAVTAQVPPKLPVRIIIIAAPKAGQQSPATSETVLVSSDSGLIQTSINVPFSADGARLTAQWEHNSATVSMSCIATGE